MVEVFQYLDFPVGSFSQRQHVEYARDLLNRHLVGRRLVNGGTHHSIGT